MGLLRLLGAIPFIPGSREGRVLTNRQNPDSGLCALSDLTMNVVDLFHKYTRRLPPNTTIFRDKNGKVIGYGAQQEDRRRL